jgi:hypothetical protein
MSSLLKTGAEWKEERCDCALVPGSLGRRCRLYLSGGGDSASSGSHWKE